MTGRPYILSELTYQTTRETAYDLAVLPWGATEAHNLHLPYGTDTIETERIAAEAARIAWDQGARVIVLPAVPFGVQTGKLDVPLCLNVNPSTQLHLLRDLADGLARNGLKKLVVLNGHGGNDFRQMISGSCFRPSPCSSARSTGTRWWIPRPTSRSRGRGPF